MVSITQILILTITWIISLNISAQEIGDVQIRLAENSFCLNHFSRANTVLVFSYCSLANTVFTVQKIQNGYFNLKMKGNLNLCLDYTSRVVGMLPCNNGVSQILAFNKKSQDSAVYRIQFATYNDICLGVAFVNLGSELGYKFCSDATELFFTVPFSDLGVSSKLVLIDIYTLSML